MLHRHRNRETADGLILNPNNVNKPVLAESQSETAAVSHRVVHLRLGQGEGPTR